MRVLVVDDSAEFLRAARVLLKQQGHEPVGLARCGEEGLALAAGLRPDAVLVDLDMPDLDGVRLAQRLRSHAGEAAVVGLSSRYDDGFHRRAAEAGCDAFIAKADLAADLPRVVRRLGGSARAVSIDVRSPLTPSPESIHA